ncbi:MAG TPA: Rnase Y domain-containing protein, partial [Tepidisphaeraceae bacterium]|nr:Rnase Y domain-containing protein [Tepidisphaeraceae bacterium]
MAEILLFGLIGLIVGAILCYLALHLTGRSAVARAQAEADQIRASARQEAENKAKELELAARQEQLRFKEKFERENESSRKKLEELESRLTKREDTLDRKLDTLSVKERNLDEMEARLAKREKEVTASEAELADILRQQREQLLGITNLSPDQAREMLLKRIEDECRVDAGAIIQRITEQATEEAKDKSRQIIL